MRPIPLPVRVAAGLVATALEQARRFPFQLAEFPITAASRAVQAGMRVQQRVTELAIKGDEVFSIFQRVEDTPPWARFDEDDAPPAPHPDQARGDQHPPWDEPSRLSRAGVRATRNGAPHADEDDSGDGLATVVPGPGVRDTGARGPEADAQGEIDESDVAHAMTPTPPSALPGYDQLSLPQLRGKLRGLSLGELEELLEHEHAHQDRAPFVTMLSNRITTVRSR